MPKRFYLIISLVFLFGVILGAFFSYNHSFPKSMKFQNLIKDTFENEVISEKTRIIIITYFKKCGHTEANEIPADKYIGQKYEDFVKGLEKGIKIEKFSDDEVILKREVDSYCDNHYYVGIKDGFVSLFKGVPGGPSILVEKTDISTEVLKEEDKNILEKGIIIKDKEEFLKIKEGLSN